MFISNLLQYLHKKQYMNICIHVAHQIFVANYITSHDNGTVIYNKNLSSAGISRC